METYKDLDFNNKATNKSSYRDILKKKKPGVVVNQAASAVANTSGKPRSGPSSNSVIGTNVHKKGLKIAERCRFVFVSRCESDTEPDDIVRYLGVEKVVTAECEKLKTRYSGYSSFKVRVSECDFDKVMNADFWPKGLFVNEFKQAQKPGENRSHQSRPIVDSEAVAGDGSVSNGGFEMGNRLSSSFLVKRSRPQRGQT